MLTAASEQDSDTKAASRRSCSPARHAGSCVPCVGSCVPRAGSCHRCISWSQTCSGLKRARLQPPSRPRSRGVSSLRAPEVGPPRLPAVPCALGVLGEYKAPALSVYFRADFGAGAPGLELAGLSSA